VGDRLGSARLVHRLSVTCGVLGTILALGASLGWVGGLVAGTLDLEQFAQDRAAAWQGFAQREPDTHSWSSSRIEAFRESLSQRLGAPEAVLQIASLGLTVPVYSATDEGSLSRGAGRIEGTAAPGKGGNLGIAGHRDGYFRVLRDLEVGAELGLETRTHRFLYRATTFSIVPSEDTTLLGDTDDPVLTLVTCYPFYFVGSAPKRFIVRADLVAVTRIDSTDPSTQERDP